MAELEEVIPRRDYKLQPQLRKKCTKCGGILTLLSHNATLSQWCNSCRIIFNIQRACSYCDNVYEYDDRIGILAEIPGLDKKQLNVEVEDGVLTISGDKHGFDNTDKAKLIRRELKHSSFKRSFELGDSLDGDKVSASFKDGILSISIPKVEPELPKKNFVKIS